MWTENFQMFKLDLERQRNQRSNCQRPLDHRKIKRIPENYLLLLYWSHQTLWLCGSQQTVRVLKETRDTGTAHTWPASWETRVHVRKPQRHGRDGHSTHLTCLLRSLFAGQEATVTTGHGTRDWFQIGKGVRQGCILLPCLTYMQSTSCEIPGWMKHKLESRLPGEISITSDMQMTPPWWQKMKKN